MSGRIDFEFGFSRPQSSRAATRSQRDPTRILVLGNFSGRTSGEATSAPISTRPIQALDLDTFDGVLARLKPRIRLETAGDGGASCDLEIESMDDFHPDTLLRRLPAFRSLLDLRQRLLDPRTFAMAAAELTSGPGDGEPEPPASPGESTGREDDAATLDRLLGGPAAGDSRPVPTTPPEARNKVDMTAFIRNLIAPHIVPEVDPLADVYVDSVDAAIQDQMRSALHDPAFQAVEAAWRGLEWLTTELELGEELQIFVCDLTKEELLADLQGAAECLDESEFFRLVHEQEAGTLGGRAWSLVLGDYYFGPSEDDVFLLAALGAVASRMGAPVLAGARADVLGCRSLVEAPDPATWTVEDNDDLDRWVGLRRSAQAPWLGLALPRVLMRLPYGSGADAVDSFPFEELAADPEHDSFLWGNSAYACTLHLVRGALGMSGTGTLDGLPAYVYQQDETKVLKPCAEVLLSDRTGRAILDRGVIPVLSHRDRNAVSILRIQSLAEPPRSLEGW